MEPSFRCQSCKARLVLVRGSQDGVQDRRSDPGLLAGLQDSRIDESFIVLDDRRGTGGPGAAGGRGLEESFVVLPGSASVLRPNAATQLSPSGHSTSSRDLQHTQSLNAAGQRSGAGPAGGTAAFPGDPTSGTAASTAGAGSRAAKAGFNAKLDTMARLCELASTVTAVDHPLCLDCAAQLKDEVQKQLEELESEIAAYSEAAKRLEAEAPVQLPQVDFEAEVAQLEAQTAAAQQEEAEAQRQLEEVMQEIRAQHVIAADIDALEERMWHDVNEYQLSLQQHISDRDALLNKIDRASQQLLLLKSTNVLNDTFRIWHDGPFGTISGFRLGRTPEFPVDWNEINAAWGQAVMLLHTMAQQCQLNFSSYRLLPMGSHPRVADKRGTYDLFGPVNKLWGGGYDKAMSVFLACLREFGDFARARDLSEGQQPVFEFPFAIEGDKIGNHTIKLSMLNKDSKWTKALKLMLANLKVALQWMIQRDVGGLAGQGPATLPSLAQEGPAHQL